MRIMDALLKALESREMEIHIADQEEEKPGASSYGRNGRLKHRVEKMESRSVS